MAKVQVPSLESAAVWEQRIDEMYSEAYSYRKQHCIDKGWFILTTETAHALAQFLRKFKLIIEPFAGTGHLANHMRDIGRLGKRYRAYDACVSHWQHPERPRANFGFTKKGCFNTNLKKAECIVMTWPNYAENLAYRVARKMVKGQYLVYQGEGRGGCTGDDKFHSYLDAHFTRVEMREKMLNHKHVKFSGMYDSWYVYIKN